MFESWLDYLIPFVIPVGLTYHVTYNIQIYTRRQLKFMTPDFRALPAINDSNSDSTGFPEPSVWKRNVQCVASPCSAGARQRACYAGLLLDRLPYTGKYSGKEIFMNWTVIGGRSGGQGAVTPFSVQILNFCNRKSSLPATPEQPSDIYDKT